MKLFKISETAFCKFLIACIRTKNVELAEKVVKQNKEKI